MWNERRMRRGPGQTSTGAARCTRCDRRGSARSSAVDSTSEVERRRTRRPPAQEIEPLRGITSIPARMSSATGRGRESRPGRLKPSTSNATTNRNRSCRPPGEGQATTEIRIVEEHSSRRPIPGRTPSTPWWRHASRDRTHRRSARLAALCGLVRCFSRRRSRRIPTPALAWSRQPPWELLPGSPLPVRPSNVAGG